MSDQTGVTDPNAEDNSSDDLVSIDLNHTAGIFQRCHTQCYRFVVRDQKRQTNIPGHSLLKVGPAVFL